MKIRIVKKVTVASGLPRHRAFPALEKLSDGSLLVAFREGTDHWKTKDGTVRVVKSRDEGNTWSEPKTVVQALGRNFGCGEGLAQLKSKVILIPFMEVIKLDKPKLIGRIPRGIPDFSIPRKQYIGVLKSFDQANTWSQLERLPLPDKFLWFNQHGKILEIGEEVWLPVAGQKKRRDVLANWHPKVF